MAELLTTRLHMLAAPLLCAIARRSWSPLLPLSAASGCCCCCRALSGATHTVDKSDAAAGAGDGVGEGCDKPIWRYISPRTAPGNRLYSWGNAELGALAIRRYLRPPPDQYRVRYRHRPVRVPFAETHRVVHAACGYGSTLLVVRGAGESSVFGSGLNTDGQLGEQRGGGGRRLLDIVADPAPLSVPLEGATDCVQRVAAGRAHSVLVSRTGAVFTVGNNSFGQCGRPAVADEAVEAAACVRRVPLDEPVVEAVCGQDHTLLLTARGQVLACGCGTDGQLGSGRLESDWRPRPVGGVLGGERIVRVSGAGDCALAVSAGGRLFGWGSNEYGQLTCCEPPDQVPHSPHHQQQQQQHSPQQQQVAEPRELFVPDCAGRIVDAVASVSMCMALADNGAVFVWGLGLLGGGPRLNMSRRPRRLPAPLFGANALSPDSKPTHLAAGAHHLAVVTNRGDLYTWGANRHGELGHGHCDVRLFPQRVSIPAQVRLVACGVDHMVALCREHV